MKICFIAFAVAILAGCGASVDSTVTEKVSAGKITNVGKIEYSNGVQFGPSVSTSTGLVVFFQNPDPVKIGKDAVLVTENYKSGMIVRKLCYEEICAPLRGTL